jgi:DNA-binding SARP family transcriptional activator/tetratricopeptide (TPR) repeat protein
MSSIRLFFLGLPRVERDGHRLTLSSAKALALLAYLALTRTPPPRERLLGLLWAESAEEAARKNLRNTLWQIRKTLGDDLLVSDRDRLSLSPEAWVDVRIFERIAAQPLANPPQAPDAPDAPDAPTLLVDPNLDLYRGPFLDGLTLTEAPDFELWMAAERERLGGLYLQTITRLVDVRRATGDWRAVVRLARRALAHDNLQETMHRALMEAYARTGERTEAIRQYDALRATLKDELGVEPLSETEQLRTAILSGDLHRTPPLPPALPPSPAPRRERRPPFAAEGTHPPAPLVGRQRHLDALTHSLDRVRSGGAHVALIAGEMGMGKTRLWQEWAATLPDAALRLETRALESTQTLPFAPLKTLFSSQACATRLFTPGTPLSPIWLAEIARLFPELRATFPALPIPAPLPPDEERHRVLEAFTQSLLTLGADPLILFVDDLHWADRASLDWFDYLIHRLSEQPILLVGAYRPNEAPTGDSSALAQYIATWAREDRLHRLTLERLSDGEARDLLRALGSDLSRADHVQRMSAGNPLFLLELSRAASDALPTTLVELITARLSRLPDSARQVLQAAAILEPDFGFAALQKVSGRGEDETLDALDALLAADLLVEHAGQYSFAHPLVATIVRNSLSNARSVVLHRRAALAREGEYAGRLPLIAGRLAAHYEGAQDVDKAAAYADMAAHHALSLAAPAEAESFLRQALQLAPTPSRYINLGRVLYFMGNFDGARAEYTSALVNAERAQDRLLALDAMLNLAETFIATARADQIDAWVARASPLLEDIDDPRMQVRAHFLLGVSGIASRPLHEAESHLLEATRLARRHGLTDMAAQACFELGNLMAERGDLAGAVQIYRDAAALAQAAGSHFQQALGYNNAAYHALLMGDLPNAEADIAKALRLADTMALSIPLQYIYSTQGEILMAQARWEEAEAWFRRGLAASERHHNPRQIANLQANLGLVARGRGDLESAALLLETARERGAEAAAPHLHTQIDLWLTEVYLDRDDHRAAADALRRAQRRLAGTDRARLIAWAERLARRLDAPSHGLGIPASLPSAPPPRS